MQVTQFLFLYRNSIQVYKKCNFFKMLYVSFLQRKRGCFNGINSVKTPGFEGRDPWPAGSRRQKSENIGGLLLDFFQLIFHLHHQALDFRIVGFRPDGIDLAAYFLGNEVQLFTV